MVCGGKHGGRAALADIELNGAHLNAQACFYQVFQIFTGSGEHLVSEVVHTYVAGKLADESSLAVVDSLGDADNQVGYFFQSVLYLGDKCLLVKGGFRKIDQHRIVSFKFACQDAGCGEPSCVASHDFHDGN